MNTIIAAQSKGCVQCERCHRCTGYYAAGAKPEIMRFIVDTQQPCLRSTRVLSHRQVASWLMHHKCGGGASGAMRENGVSLTKQTQVVRVHAHAHTHDHELPCSPIDHRRSAQHATVAPGRLSKPHSFIFSAAAAVESAAAGGPPQVWHAPSTR